MVVLVIWERECYCCRVVAFLLWNSCVKDGFVKIRRLSRLKNVGYENIFP